MKRTPFHGIHQSLGAKLIEFGGYEMPVQYPSGIVKEHLAVRSAVGVFDVSHMGEFEVRGKSAMKFLQRVTINDVARLSEGKAQYSAMCYDDGGIVDDLLVYHCGSHYLLVVNASNIAKDFEWLQSHLKGDVTLKDVSDTTALLAIQGPRSLAALQPISDVDLAAIPYYRFVRGTVAGIPMMISRTGYTGELGFELYGEIDDSQAKKLWNSIFDAGKEFGILPVGLGARDTLRLEMGYCLYGNDIDQTTNPLEAGLGWITKLDKSEFVGKPILVKAKGHGLKRKLVGFIVSDKNVPRHGYAINAHNGSSGQVTSGTFSPSLRKGIGLGYVAMKDAAVGTELVVDVRGKEVPATVVNIPFLQKR